MNEAPNKPPVGLPEGFSLDALMAGDEDVVHHARNAAERILDTQTTLEAENARLASQIEESKLDPLTGLPNRQALQEAYDEFRAGAQAGNRRQQPKGPSNGYMLFLDLDGFKEENDKNGHQAGDKVLIASAEIMQSNTRKHDFVARLGGDEFVILLPGITTERATDAAHAILEEVNDLTPVGVSIGIGKIDASETLDVALERTDKAMYAAKRAGKNRVVNLDELEQTA